MLNNSYTPSLNPTKHATEGIEYVHQYAQPSQSSPFIHTFPSPYDTDEQDEEQQELQAEKEEQNKVGESPKSGFLRLAGGNNFQELINRFLIPGHEEIFNLRSEIRRSRKVRRSSLLSARLVDQLKFEEQRTHLYQLQISLFRNPRGAYCHILA